LAAGKSGVSSKASERKKFVLEKFLEEGEDLEEGKSCYRKNE